jgi:hypothetical protein
MGVAWVSGAAAEPDLQLDPVGTRDRPGWGVALASSCKEVRIGIARTAQYRQMMRLMFTT